MRWALGAPARGAGPAGERTLPVAALFKDDGIDYVAKRADEILTEITLPASDGWSSAYLKLRRRGSFDFPVLGVAVPVRREDDTAQQRELPGATRQMSPSFFMQKPMAFRQS